MEMKYSDTIAAISTAVSEAGIGIVRISGSEAFEIVDKIYQSKSNKKIKMQKSHTIHYGFIVNKGNTIDEVLVSLMKGPHSYTGEDTVEINCHGGVYVVKKILEIVLENGARPAEPGEFTKRAFLNGRMDLSQAEAVIDVIKSRNEYALQSSVSQLKGSITNIIQDIRRRIIYHTAFIETALDDPEHISVDKYGQTLKIEAEKIREELLELITSFDDGRVMKEGINTVILGKPNAGKSSLLNVLAGQERAIVTDIAGTTRDVLEETINMHGISLNVMDTAGIRNTDNVVEKIGVDKAREYASGADLIIYVIDASTSMDENDDEILHIIRKKKSIILLNKSDLDMIITKEKVKTLYKEGNPAKINEKLPPIIEISTKNNDGIDNLANILEKMFYNGTITFNNEVYITSIRHKNAIKLAFDSIGKVIDSIDNGLPEDFYSIDLMDAYESLGSITGETIGEDLVNEIFSKFCMGK